MFYIFKVFSTNLLTTLWLPALFFLRGNGKFWGKHFQIFKLELKLALASEAVVADVPQNRCS